MFIIDIDGVKNLIYYKAFNVLYIVICKTVIKETLDWGFR